MRNQLLAARWGFGHGPGLAPWFVSGELLLRDGFMASDVLIDPHGLPGFSCL